MFHELIMITFFIIICYLFCVMCNFIYLVLSVFHLNSIISDDPCQIILSGLIVSFRFVYFIFIEFVIRWLLFFRHFYPFSFLLLLINYHLLFTFKKMNFARQEGDVCSIWCNVLQGISCTEAKICAKTFEYHIKYLYLILLINQLNILITS